MYQMPHRDGVRIGGQLGEPLANRVVDRQPSLLDGQRRGECRELLRHGPDVKHGFGRDRHVVLEAGHSVAAFVGDPSPFEHGDGATRRILPIELLEHRVDGGRGDLS